MRPMPTSVFALLLALCPLRADAADASVGRYIVSFDEAPVALFDGDIIDGVAMKATRPTPGEARLDLRTPAVQAYRKHLHGVRGEHLRSASAQVGRALEPVAAFEVVDHAVVLELTAKEAERLRQSPGVRAVDRDQQRPLLGDASARWIGADRVWQGIDGVATRGEGVVIGILDSGINRQHPSFAATSAIDGYVHHNPRQRWFGLCVATPALCNTKLIGIHDFTTCAPGAADCNDREVNNGLDFHGHGAHVASIAAGNPIDADLAIVLGGNPGRGTISGVAPRANLISYKIGERDLIARDSWILAGLEQAVVDGVDVINLSFPTASGNPWSAPLGRALLAVRAANVVVAAAAGNAGRTSGALGNDAPWVMAVASTTHDRSIAAGAVQIDPAGGDRRSPFSSFGPSPVGDFLRPSLSAPGQQIIGAGHSGNGVWLASGTSMAAPQVAGAAALLKAARPHWRVADIESALIATAAPVVRSADGSRRALIREQGAGRVDVAAALRAGLSFPITADDFEAAHPGQGGDPRALNQPGIMHSACMERCSFTRRVRDLAGGGRWQVEIDAPSGLTVTVQPTEFVLVGDAEQSLQIDVDVAPQALGRWKDASIRLRRIDGPPGAVSDARIPVAVYATPGALPAQIRIAAVADRGHFDVDLSGLARWPQLRLAATEPAVPRHSRIVLAQDPLPDAPMSGPGPGRHLAELTLPGNSAGRNFRLIATTRSVTSPDVDLFVGIDTGGGARAADLRCSSLGLDANERCDIELPGAQAAQTVWLLVQNYRAGPTGTDEVQLTTQLIDRGRDAGRALVVTGPGHVETGTARLRLAWDQPPLVGERESISMLTMATGDNTPFAEIEVSLAAAAAALAPRMLGPGRHRLQLRPGTAHERLAIDVPANAGALVVRTQSAGSIDLYAARTTRPGGPALGQAPARSQAQASSLGAGGNKTLRIEGAVLQPGRWYLTPVNTGDDVADVDLDVDLEYVGAAPAFAPGAYFNPARSGAGAFVYDIGDQRGFIWYTYLQDGTPTWYLGVAPRPATGQGMWQVGLNRFAWDGSDARPTPVGEAILTMDESGAFQFGWNLDGESGSERYERLDTGACPSHAGAALDATGIWFSPSRPGFGYSINVGTGVETHAAYFYDAQGVARWLFGAAAPFGATRIDLSTYTGACPSCAYVAPTTQPAGVLTRQYAAGGASATIGVEFSLPPPLAGAWTLELPAVRMTDPVGCH